MVTKHNNAVLEDISEMATVVDAIFVTFGLDTSKYTAQAKCHQDRCTARKKPRWCREERRRGFQNFEGAG